MSYPKSLVATLLIGAAVAAAPADARRKPPHGPERGYDSLAQPIVQRTDYVMDLVSRDDRLSPTERSRLNAWFASLGVGYGDRIWVEEPYGPTTARQDVARVAAEYGLLLSDGAPVTAGAVQPGTVRVILSRSFAYVPGCPRVDTYRGPSSVDANYGCSVNSNLSAMIADPGDLVLGQAGASLRDTGTAAKAIKVYRETPPTGAKGLTQQSSKEGGK
jgi:pilus assembly protein CpaD